MDARKCSKNRSRLTGAVLAALLALGAVGCSGGGPGTSSGPTTGGEALCSASGRTVPASSDELPEAIASTREAILAAAVACDYDGLAGLASDGFTFSFGDADDPAAYWRDAEASGEPVLATIVAVLAEPSADVDGAHVWPRASTGDATPADVQAMADAIGVDPATWFVDDDYLGPRIGIAADGTWTFFVSGD